MNLLDLICLAVIVVVAAKCVAWVIQFRTGNGGVVDPIWAWSLGLLAVLFGVAGSAPPEVRMLVALMGGVWGMRLGTHLWMRMAGKPEDFRYAKLRLDWDRHAHRNLFFSTSSRTCSRWSWLRRLSRRPATGPTACRWG